jgi:hypothetical protein
VSPGSAASRAALGARAPTQARVSSPRRAASEDTKEAGEVDSWLHHQRAEALEELDGRQHQHRRSSPGPLQPVVESAVVSAGEAVEGNGAAGTVRAQALEALPVVGMGVGVGVKGEALEEGTAAARSRWESLRAFREGASEGFGRLWWATESCAWGRPSGKRAWQRASTFRATWRSSLATSLSEGGGSLSEGVARAVEDAVAHQHVEVGMEPQVPCQPLHEGDGAGLWAVNPQALGDATLEVEDGLDEVPQDGTQQRGVHGQRARLAICRPHRRRATDAASWRIPSHGTRARHRCRLNPRPELPSAPSGHAAWRRRRRREAGHFAAPRRGP